MRKLIKIYHGSGISELPEGKEDNRYLIVDYLLAGMPCTRRRYFNSKTVGMMHRLEGPSFVDSSNTFYYLYGLHTGSCNYKFIQVLLKYAKVNLST